jgi:alkylmercury lyase
MLDAGAMRELLKAMTAQEVAQRLQPLFPTLDERDRQLSLAVYRGLARGAPVSLPAGSLNRMRDWPGVYYNAEGRVTGFWGLSLASTRHRLRVHGRDLFTWCAWDTLFLPAVLGTRIEVASTCRATGEPVRLAVRPDAVEWSEPRELAVSFAVPDSEAVRADVISSFCHHVHFFASKKAQLPPSAFLLPLEEAFHVGQLLNRRRYGAAP